MKLSKLIGSHPRFFASLFFNLKCFPLKTALHLPVMLFGRVYTKGCKKGCIELEGKIHTGMVKIGYCAVRWRPPYIMTSYTNQGKHMVKGDFTIGAGSIVSIGRRGVLTTGDGCWLNANSKIICEDSIVMEDKVLCSWDIQIMDSDLHYICKNNRIANNHNSIFIGAYSWICNRATIGRGAFVPPKSIVASYSLVNANFNQYDEKLLLAGIPAAVKSIGIHRVMSKWGGVTVLDKELRKIFSVSDEQFVDIDDERLKEIKEKMIQ